MVLKTFNFAVASLLPFVIAGPDAAGVLPSDDLVGPVWIATDFYDGQSLAPVATVGVSRPTLQFDDDGGYTGFTGCNSFFASYSDLTDTTIHFDDIRGMTRAGCGSDQLEQQENAFYKLFDNLGTTEYIIQPGTDGKGLELSNQGDGVVARFEEKEKPTILDVEWVATEVVNKHEEGGWNFGYPFGNSITKHGDVTLHLDSKDLLISGFGGCNGFSGTFSDMTKKSFTIDPDSMISSRKGCSSEVMEQEYAILSLLQGPITYRFYRDGTLELHGGDNGWTVIGRYKKGEATGFDGYNQMN